MNGAQAFVAALRRNGADLVFGIPGVHTLPLYDALYDAPDIRPVLVRHESGASMAADAYARVSGRPGVCVAVPGPGATNLSTGVGVAFADSVPMVVVTSQIPRELLGRAAVHDLDIESIYKPLVKACVRADSPDAVGPAIDQAFALAMSGRRGPVQVMLWVDALSKEVAFAKEESEGAPHPPHASDEDISEAAQTINESQNLAIVLGDGAVDSGAMDLILELAERRGAIIGTSVSARGAIAEDDPRSIGPICWESAIAALREADACLAIGTRFSEISTLAWSVQIPPTLIRIDIDPTQLQKNYPAKHALAGDALAVMTTLLPHIEAIYPDTAIRQRNVETQSSLGSARQATRDAGSEKPLHPRWLTTTLRDTFPDDTIFTTDGSATEFWLSEPSFPIRRSRTFLVPEVSQTMGYALPAAVGARMAADTQHVVCVTGDGSLVMSLSELATAVDLDKPLIIVIFDDGYYNALKIYQDGLFNGRRIGVKLNNPDFVSLARAMGAEAVQVTDPGDLIPALRWAQSNTGVTVVDVVTDERPLPIRYERRVQQMKAEA